MITRRSVFFFLIFELPKDVIISRVVIIIINLLYFFFQRSGTILSSADYNESAFIFVKTQSM